MSEPTRMSAMGDRGFAAGESASGDSSFVDAPAFERDGTSSDSEAVEPALLIAGEAK